MRSIIATLVHTLLAMDVTKRALVIALAKEGLGQRAIVQKTGYSRSFVQRWYARETAEDASRSGRPPKLTARVLSKVRGVMKVRCGLLRFMC